MKKNPVNQIIKKIRPCVRTSQVMDSIKQDVSFSRFNNTYGVSILGLKLSLFGTKYFLIGKLTEVSPLRFIEKYIKHQSQQKSSEMF